MSKKIRCENVRKGKKMELLGYCYSVVAMNCVCLCFFFRFENFVIFCFSLHSPFILIRFHFSCHEFCLDTTWNTFISCDAYEANTIPSLTLSYQNRAMQALFVLFTVLSFFHSLTVCVPSSPCFSYPYLFNVTTS